MDPALAQSFFAPGFRQRCFQQQLLAHVWTEATRSRRLCLLRLNLSPFPGLKTSFGLEFLFNACLCNVLIRD